MATPGFRRPRLPCDSSRQHPAAARGVSTLGDIALQRKATAYVIYATGAINWACLAVCDWGMYCRPATPHERLSPRLLIIKLVNRML